MIPYMIACSPKSPSASNTSIVCFWMQRTFLFFFFKDSVWYDQFTDLCNINRKDVWLDLWMRSLNLSCLNTMTNILKQPLTSTFASNNIRFTAHVNSCEVTFLLFFYLVVTLTVLFDIVERMLVNDSEHDAFLMASLLVLCLNFFLKQF